MPRFALHRPGCMASATSRQTRTVCVVDLQPTDYRGWDSLANASGLRLQFLGSADEALRFSRANSVDLWVVNIALPGLPGHELCGTLKAHNPRATVFAVANEYSATAERLALANRATLFGVKPEHHSWLSQWLSARLQRLALTSAA